MSFLRKEWLFQLVMTIIAVGLFAIAASATTVTLSAPSPGPSPTPNPSPTTMLAPTGTFPVNAVVASVPSGYSVRVVFYRNDVPLETDYSSPYELSQTVLGQDTYTYRARAYISNGVSPETWVDSADWILTVNTPRVFTMGDAVPPPPGPTPTPTPYTTRGPRSGGAVDHTEDIERALAYLESQGGGTLFFPCAPRSNGFAQYYISDTITVPSNVTLQSESSEFGGILPGITPKYSGRCGIYWYDPTSSRTATDTCYTSTPSGLQNKPMFLIAGGTTRVRFKDMALQSRVYGLDCAPYDSSAVDGEDFAADNISAIELNSDTGTPGNISDVIFENISAAHFKYGIKAVGPTTSTDRKIFNIKMRGYRPVANHRQIFIDSPYAYDWDLQNVNFTTMMEDQGGVEIVKAGRPSGFTGENGGLKFLQLSCDGNMFREDYPPAFCLDVKKHSGLYFRQLHFEGVDNAIHVRDISPSTNPDPIVIETSLLAGKFEDASMQLYLIGNNIYGSVADETDFRWDNGRMDFIDDGVESDVFDCGNFFTDFTDVPGNPDNSADPDNPAQDNPNTFVPQMIFSHSERERGNFNAKVGSGPVYRKSHTVCPATISEYGGRFFDSGVLPTETGTYSTILTTSNQTSRCGSGVSIETCVETFLNTGGTVYIGSLFPVSRTINVPSGAQLISAPGAGFELVTTDDEPLLRLTPPTFATSPHGISSVILRNLLLKTDLSGKTGVEIVAENGSSVGVSRDLHFSGLTIRGFEKGLYAHQSSSPPYWHPMINGVSMKNMTFLYNGTALDIHSANASNWNVMNLTMISASSDAIGWKQYNGGHLGIQDAHCEGSEKSMAHCFFTQMGSTFFLNGLKKSNNVESVFTVGPSFWGFYSSYKARHPWVMTVRNNDFTGATFSVYGKSVITSMNNAYGVTHVENDVDFGGTDNEATKTRATFCNDTYVPDLYDGLDSTYPNPWIGRETPTRTYCGDPQAPWSEPINLGGEADDIPLTGNFYTDLAADDFVVFRSNSSSSTVLFRSQDGTRSEELTVPFTGDYAFAGKISGSQTQIIAWDNATGDFNWAAVNPTPSATPAVGTTTNFHWGATGDIPIVGNFFNNSSDLDAVGIYRPSSADFWLYNNATSTWVVRTFGTHYGTKVFVGDFLGLGYDQIAQYVSGSTGTWHILDGSNGNTTTVSQGTTGDIPVAGGHYLPIPSGKVYCDQLAVWTPSTTLLQIKDGSTACSATPRSETMVWGSKNEFVNATAETFDSADDVILPIMGASGISRPGAYRPFNSHFPVSMGNGQWWFHDPF